MRRLAIAAGAAAVLLAGCGGSELSAQERATVAGAKAKVSAAAAFGDNADRAVDRLIALYRSKPDAKYGGETMREVLQDAASDIDAYEPDLAAKLDRATR